jgi:hypothetical protein
MRRWRSSITDLFKRETGKKADFSINSGAVIGYFTELSLLTGGSEES